MTAPDTRSSSLLGNNQAYRIPCFNGAPCYRGVMSCGRSGLRWQPFQRRNTQGARALPKMVENFARDVAPADMHGRLDAPAFHRNKDPASCHTEIHCWMSCEGDIIEIGSGTGQHAVTFAAAEWRGLTFWPSDPLA